MRKYSVILAAVMIFAACACSWADVEIVPENIPDYNFVQYLLSITNGDFTLTDAEIAGITELNLAGMDIESLQGIEFFTALTSLDCSNNSLRVLDLGSNNALTSVNCDEQNGLGIAITASGNTAYPYMTDFTGLMTSEQAARVFDVQGKGANDSYIATTFTDGIAMFASLPDSITYSYRTYANYDQIDMAVRIGNGVGIDPETFPDEVFGPYVAQTFDTDGDGILFASEIAAVEAISVASMDIKSLEGIKYFTSLKRLYCEKNSIESLDLSGLTALEYVYCYENSNMVSLDVSGCTSLKELNCADNSIASLNIEGCNNLEVLNARDNAITGTIDLHGITTLRRINLRLNQLTSLDVHGCTALTEIYARDNQLQELNITGCNALEYLGCQTEASSEPEHTNRIKTLDLSGKTNLKELWCKRNELTALDVSDCTALVSLSLERNQVTSLNVSNNTLLEYLNCGSNDIGTLDVSKNTKLTHLDAWDCGLSELDLSNNTELEYLELGGAIANENTHNCLTTIDVSNNTKLTYLALDLNKLTSIDVSMLPLLETLMFQYNDITSVDLSNNTALKALYCHDSGLTELDLSANTALTFLSCYSNDITTLDLSNNPLISELRTGTSGIMAEVPELRLTYSPDASMPYHTDMKDYTGSDYTNIIADSVKGYTSAGDEILTSYMADGTADFERMPVKVVYTYDTGYTGSADISADMKVALVPDPENFFSPLTISVDVVSVVVSREVVTVVSREVVVSKEIIVSPEISVEVSVEVRTVGVSNSSSGGCNALSGTMLLSLLTGLAGFITARKH